MIRLLLQYTYMVTVSLPLVTSSRTMVREGFMFYKGSSSFFQREISEVPPPITAKFCRVVRSMFSLQMLVKNFEACPPKKNWGKKHAKFGSISDPFLLWARIFSDWTEISKIRKLFDWQHFVPCWVKKFGELWSTNHGDLEVQLYPENRLFWNTIFRPLGSAAPQNFYMCYRMSKSC